jgi:hypothetical protein
MSFLTPLYLLGALAIALPVWFHLIRRTTRRRMPFSSLLFVRPAPPRLTKRSRLEDLLLLALRALVLGLLAVGFARPFVMADTPADASTSPPARTVVLLDTSASMRRDGIWQQAQERVRAIIDAAGPADQLALVAFDRTPRILVRFEDGAGLAPADRAALWRQQLAALEPGWGDTRLDQALMLAAEVAAEDAGAVSIGRREVVVVSDLQRGSELADLQGFAWPDGVATRVEVLEPSTPGNAGLQMVADRRSLGADLEPSFRVRITNSPDATTSQFRLRWADIGGDAVPVAEAEAYVPGGQTRVVSVPLPPPGQEAAELRLLGDAAAFDDTLYVVPPQPVVLRVAYFGAESDADPSRPLYFLRRAFADTPRLSVQLDVHPPDAPPEADALTDCALIVATDAPGDAAAQAIHAALRGGGNLLFAPVRPEAMSALPALAGSDPISPAADKRPTGYALLGDIDFSHALLAPFASPAYSDFSGIHFWRYRSVFSEEVPSARILARFDSGDPALLEIPVGAGRLWLLTSCWHPDDSQLALSSKFVPLLYSMLDLTEGGLSPDGPYAVGDRLPVPAGPGEQVLLHGPDGSEIAIDAAAAPFVETDRPGIYRFAGGDDPHAAIAVNLAAAESRTEPLPVDELAQLGVPFASAADADRAADPRQVAVVANTEMEARQRGWRFVLLAAAAAAIIETGLAGRTARRHTQPEGAAA